MQGLLAHRPLLPRTPYGELDTGHDEIPRRIHQVILVLDDSTFLVTAVHAVLGEPIEQGLEDLQPPGREARPHLIEADFDGVVGLRESQAEFDVFGEELLPVALLAPAGRGVDDARYP